MTKTNNDKVWWKSWLGALTGVGSLCTIIVGSITWQYSTFTPYQVVAMADEKVETMVVELSNETIKSFKSINETNQQMQMSIKRNDLRYTYDRLMDEKYRIRKLLKSNPEDEDLQKDLEKNKSRIEEVENQLQGLK